MASVSRKWQKLWYSCPKPPSPCATRSQACRCAGMSHRCSARPQHRQHIPITTTETMDHVGMQCITEASVVLHSEFSRSLRLAQLKSYGEVALGLSVPYTEGSVTKSDIKKQGVGAYAGALPCCSGGCTSHKRRCCGMCALCLHTAGRYSVPATRMTPSLLTPCPHGQTTAY